MIAFVSKVDFRKRPSKETFKCEKGLIVGKMRNSVRYVWSGPECRMPGMPNRLG